MGFVGCFPNGPMRERGSWYEPCSSLGTSTPPGARGVRMDRRWEGYLLIRVPIGRRGIRSRSSAASRILLPVLGARRSDGLFPRVGGRGRHERSSEDIDRGGRGRVHGGEGGEPPRKRKAPLDPSSVLYRFHPNLQTMGRVGMNL